MARGGGRDDGGDRPGNGDDADRSADDFPGSALFAGGDPMKILARLHADDPLELWPRCVEHLSEQAVLVQPERLYMRLAARLAYGGAAYRGDPPLGAWIAERTVVSLRELLREDQEEEHRELPQGLEQDARYVFLSKALGIEIGLTPRVCNRFNQLPLDQRAAFFGVLVEGRGILGYAQEKSLDPEDVKALLRRAFRGIGLRKEPDLRRFEWGDEGLPEGGHDD